MIDVIVLSPGATLFEGKARRVILPGEQGVFEVFQFHRPLVSRLLPGMVVVDDQPFLIKRGAVKVTRRSVMAIVEPAAARPG